MIIILNNSGYRNNTTIGSLIAMIEPSVNTVAFYFHEKAWAQVPALKDRQWMTKFKTASFATIHFSVAFTVVYLLTGDAFFGGEPC